MFKHTSIKASNAYLISICIIKCVYLKTIIASTSNVIKATKLYVVEMPY